MLLDLLLQCALSIPKFSLLRVPQLKAQFSATSFKTSHSYLTRKTKKHGERTTPFTLSPLYTSSLLIPTLITPRGAQGVPRNQRDFLLLTATRRRPPVGQDDSLLLAAFHVGVQRLAQNCVEPLVAAEVGNAVF